MREEALVMGWSPVFLSCHLVVRVEKGQQLVARVMIWVRVDEPELEGGGVRRERAAQACLPGMCEGWVGAPRAAGLGIFLETLSEQPLDTVAASLSQCPMVRYRAPALGQTPVP